MPITCISPTTVAPTCVSASVVAPTCVNPVVLAGEFHLFNPDDIEVSFDDLYTLAPGVHVFTIRNTGEGRLDIGFITIDDPTYLVTQPVDNTLESGEETTFTITAPTP
jgi:hypothetical protein